MARIEQHAGDRLQFAPAAPLPAEHQKRDRCRSEENRGDQTLGQRGERKGGPHAIEAAGTATLQASDETPKSVKQKEAE